VDVAGDAAEKGEREQEERKQRYQRVIGNRRRVRQVVAVIEAEETAPERLGGQSKDLERSFQLSALFIQLSAVSSQLRKLRVVS
jgi:hypothetical protein